jgi:hypothetical protein
MKRTRVSSSAFIAITVSVLILSTCLGIMPAGAAPPSKTTCTSSTGASWDQVQTGACRFTVLTDFFSVAVRDNNTGLVWYLKGTGSGSWGEATNSCITNVGVFNQKGWRLPSIAELASLIDTTASPTLPAGHPFTNIQPSAYWSASTLADNSANAWFVNFADGSVSTAGKATIALVWCVRGPMQESVY